jgi:hypothetical protein
MKKFAIGISALMLIVPPLNAQVRIVTPEAKAAARIRELYLMLNSVSLRCNSIGFDLQKDFSLFSARQVQPLARAEATLKQYFGVQTKADLRSGFDRFHIKMLNFYGTGRTDPQSCGRFGKLLALLGNGDPDGVSLTKIAEIMVPKPLIDDEK